MADQPLSVLILGAPSVRWQGQEIHIQRKIPRALLYYLAGHPQPIQRLDLCLMFWPDADESESRRRLREILSKLRADLPDPEVLDASRDAVSLDASRVFVDLLEFQNLLNESRRTASLVPRNEPLPIHIQQKLARAADLWRGPNLLAGFDWPASDTYDQWVMETSRVMEHSFQFCLLRLADSASASGDLEQTFHWLQKAANIDPYNSDLHYRTLTTLMEIGRQAEISNYCNYIRELYKDGEIPAVLTQLCHKINSFTNLQVQPRIDWPPAVSLRVPMVNRVEELQRLRQAANRGGSAVILGEPGSGKTRLAYEFYRQQDPASRLVLLDCQENERSLPFQALISSLRKSIHPDEWQFLGAPYRTQIAALLPELLMLFKDQPAFQGFNASETSLQIFEAFFQVMALLAKKQRITFILENAQWCDDSSLSAVEYLLGQGFFSPPNFLVITSRSEVLDVDLIKFLDHPRRGVPNQRVSLPLLGLEGIRELGQFILADDLSETLLERIQLDTGGNPLYVIEWLKSSLLQRSLDPGGRIEEPPKGGLTSLMRDRLKILDPISRQVLAAAAILGNQFSISQVEQVANLPAEQITSGLERLEGLNLIRPSGDTSDYSFIHDQIREVLLSDLSLARKRMLHIRAARILEEEFTSDENPNAARIAAHYEAGSEPNAAIQAWIKAASYSLRLFSLKEMERCFQRAEKLVHDFGRNLPDETIYQLYSTWGFLANQATNLKEAERIFSILLTIGEQRRNRKIMGTAQTGLAQYHHQVGEMEQALAAANRAVLLLENLPDLLEKANALFTRGSILIILSQFDRSHHDLKTVISITAEAQDPLILQIRALSEALLGIILNLQGQPIQAETISRQALQSSRECQAPFAESNALVSLTMAAFYQFKYAECLRLAEEGIQFSQPYQFWHNLGYFHIWQAFVFLTKGLLDQCWSSLQTLHMIAVNHRCEDLLASEWLIRGQMNRFLWNFPAALECFQQGGAISYNSHDRLELLAQQAIVLGMTGEYEESIKVFETVLVQAKASEVGLVYYPALTSRLGALALALPPGQLLEDAEIALKEIQACEIADIQEFINYGLAVAQLRAGNLEAALSTADRFSRYAQNADTPWLKIIDFTLQLIFASATGQPISGMAQQNIQATLDYLDAHTRHPDLRPDFESLRERLLSQI